jgi:hypothetical protein
MLSVRVRRGLKLARVAAGVSLCALASYCFVVKTNSSIMDTFEVSLGIFSAQVFMLADAKFDLLGYVRSPLFTVGLIAKAACILSLVLLNIFHIYCALETVFLAVSFVIWPIEQFYSYWRFRTVRPA